MTPPEAVQSQPGQSQPGQSQPGQSQPGRAEAGQQARVVAGRYRLGERLGRGGMGIVWAARDELLARPVAVKEVRLPAAVDPAERDLLRERTLREARAAARLDHPCAVRMFDVCEEDEQAYLVMELIEGRTLSEVVRDDGPIAPGQAAEIGVCLLDALTAAHAAGIIHRDVKPGNVIVRADGRVTLTDFGIASTADDPSITSTGLLLGSPAYIAPERARGGTPDPASDLWSLGATLYTAVEGRPPFDRVDPVATLAAVVTDEHEPTRLAGPGLGPVLDRLLDKDQAARPSAPELRRLLQSVAVDPAAQIRLPEVGAPSAGHARIGGHTVAVRPTDAEPEPSLAVRSFAWVGLCLVVFAVAAGAALLLRAG
jgi:eukaryotic-like serine/threonine-protein kinase